MSGCFCFPRGKRAITQQGVTLIELMVAILIGLVLVLAITTLLIKGESQKRVTTSVNDREQSGAYATLLLDRALRSAGSGLAQTSVVGGYGCALTAQKSGAAILPRATTWPDPFASFPLAPRLAPVLIQKGAAVDDSDTLMVMTGAAADGDVPRPIRGGSGNQAQLDGTLQIIGGDIVLLTNDGSDCLIEQVQNGFLGSDTQPALNFAGAYFTTGSPTAPLSSLLVSGAYLSELGNVNDGATPPQFMLYGINSQYQLTSYDMLQTGPASATTGDSAQPIADGVEKLYALYGVDTDGDGKVDNWVTPEGVWSIDQLSIDPTRLKQVLAVRLALLLRGALAEKDAVPQQVVAADGTIKIFADVPAVTHTLTLSTDEQRYRYQLIDTVVPLRNALLVSAP
jgi:type IV pilus assembly protein PilW